MSEEDTLGLIGTTIADKYAIESVVGAGGFALVYKAQHKVWKRPVAVKVFKALGEVAASQREKLLEEFVREGALLAELSERSAAIVQARDIGTLTTPKGHEVPYMVLEWLEGSTLETVLAREKAEGLPRRSLTQTVTLLNIVAEALALAHARGIAHRDVKPANVFVLGILRAPSPGVKLLDFGIAKVVQDAQKMAGSFNKTAGHLTSFTPAYGAPEQFNRAAGATGPWTDVFALALVVVEVLTGKDPLQGDDLVQLAVASSNPNARPTPRARGATVSDDVEAVMAKALAVNPNDRWQDAGAMWSELRRAAEMSASPSSRRISSSLALDATAVAPAEALPIAASATMPVVEPDKKGPPIVAIGAVLAALAAGGYFATRHSAPPPAPAGVATAPPAATPPATASVAPALGCPPGMLAIQGGAYFMGSEGPEALDDEKPPHQVTLSPYCIDKDEVTVARYRACSNIGGCKKATYNEWPEISAADRATYDPLCNFADPKRAEHPINCLDWDMAQTFCRSAGARLPTEAEWELAARGPDGRTYPWGDDKPAPDLLNACGNECVAWGKAHKTTLAPMYAGDDGFPNTAPVGSFPKGRSRYGLDDVVGNVWEWTADWHAPYTKDEAKDPKGPATGARRVIRGGSWNGENAAWVRPTFRYSDDPTKRSYGIGLRCAKSM